MMRLRSLLLIVCFACSLPLSSEGALYLKDNLKRADKGDFLVTSQNKNYTLLHIFDKEDNRMTIEEITVPTCRMPKQGCAWRQWVSDGAPYNTSWVMYEVNLDTGLIGEYFSFTKNCWCRKPPMESFLSTLLNLRLMLIPPKARKKVGHAAGPGATNWKCLWQPPLIIDGKRIQGVAFDAWRTRWPKDGTELSGKIIEVYVPAEHEKYPSYFPYWLQIKGLIGKATVRIIDSGTGLESPRSALPRRVQVILPEPKSES